MPEQDTATLCDVETEALVDAAQVEHRTTERAAARELAEAERKYWDLLARSSTQS